MKKILEIGSGQGFNSFFLSKNNNVVGIDMSKKDIAISKKRYPQVEFFYMNAEKLKFKNNSFDEVYAMDILEHVNNLEKTIKEIYRVLRVKGRLIINIPYYKSEYWLLKIRPTFHKEIHHVRVFQENELDKLLKKKKFKLIKKEKRDFLQHLELFFLFKRKINSNTQLSIGSWRDNPLTIFVHITYLYFVPSVLKTPLVYFPIWVITIPIGEFINFFGNKIFPRSIYYEFIKR